MILRSSCAFCNKKSLRTKYNFGDYSIVECGSCGFVLRDRILSRQEEQSLYGKDYYTNLQREYFINCLAPNPKDKSRLNDFSKRLDLLQKVIGKKKKICLLDVGAGTGAFSFLAEKRGWETQSVEISSFATNIARRKFGVKMYCGDVSDSRFVESKFDVATLWEAIANIEDTRKLLETLRKKLKKDGNVAILTTVIDSWLFYAADIICRLTFDRVTYFVKEGYPIHHANHFSRKILKKALKSEGFKIIYHENVEIPYKYTKLPKLFWPFLIVMGNIAKLFGSTIQVMMIAKKV